MECSVYCSVPNGEAFYAKLLVVFGEQVFCYFFKVAYGVCPAVAVAVVGGVVLVGFCVVVLARAGVLVGGGVGSVFGGDCGGCFVHSVSISPLRVFVKCLCEE